MLDKKYRLFRLIESYINDFKGKEIQSFYGKGTKIKIENLDFISQGSFLLIDVKIVLGELIKEEYLDREMVDYVIQDALVYFYPELGVKCVVSWDS